MTMLTYHNDPNLKAYVLAQLAAHRAADEIIQGTYWDGHRGCAVGCLVHDPHGGHDQYETRWGIPEWLARLEDDVFEGLPVELAKDWPARFMGAIPVGVEITERVADLLAIARLETEIIPLAPSWPESVREQVLDAVRGVVVVLRDGGDRDAARAAAETAGWSAGSAWSAAYEREADRIITALTTEGTTSHE